MPFTSSSFQGIIMIAGFVGTWAAIIWFAVMK